jgi:hypothetical protein
MPATALVTTLWIGEEAAEGIGVAREQLVRPALRECLAGLQVDQYTSRIQQNDSIARDVDGVVKAKHELCAWSKDSTTTAGAFVISVLPLAVALTVYRCPPGSIGRARIAPAYVTADLPDGPLRQHPRCWICLYASATEW